jgi:asparagine synthase (glutamine-hydrolysing)
MCGITGILHFGSLEKSNEIIRKMTKSISHRGPDAEGFYSDTLISLGHRRLSIIDVTDQANQPMVDRNGRYILSFNGEIYNYRQIRSVLSNWSFTTNSDTEVLLAAFSTWGIQCLNRIDGIFAFAIWDLHEKTLWLARDRMGVKPLYYLQQGKTILFASEIRALLSSELIQSTIDKCGLTHYLLFQSTSNDFPIVKGIQELNAAKYLQITIDKIVEHSYWKPNQLKENYDFNYEDCAKTVFKLLENSVNKRMVSDVPISAYLSGGIDSSTIVALMSLHSSSPINTFTLAFKETGYDESAYANIIAKRFETNHTNIILDEEQLLGEVVNGLNAMDCPTADGINTYILSTAIRDANIKVALSGVGADELFAGYPGFGYFQKIQRNAFLFNKSIYLRKGITALLEVLHGEKFGRFNQLLQSDSSEIHDVYPAFRQFLSPAKLRNILADQSCISDVKSRLMSELSSLNHPHNLSRYSLAEYKVYATHTLLKDVDQMSMANGLEVREPFFDIDLINYVLAVPDHYKVGKFPKQLLLDSISPLLPAEIINRKKKGFVLPWEKWMRNELKSFCEAQIIECSERDFVNKAQLIKYWNRFLKRDPSIRWIELWQFVVLNYWMNRNNVVYQA